MVHSKIDDEMYHWLRSIGAMNSFAEAGKHSKSGNQANTQRQAAADRQENLEAPSRERFVILPRELIIGTRTQGAC
jgi:hypothetical protein